MTLNFMDELLQLFTLQMIIDFNHPTHDIQFQYSFILLLLRAYELKIVM